MNLSTLLGRKDTDRDSTTFACRRFVGRAQGVVQDGGELFAKRLTKIVHNDGLLTVHRLHNLAERGWFCDRSTLRAKCFTQPLDGRLHLVIEELLLRPLDRFGDYRMVKRGTTMSLGNRELLLTHPKAFDGFRRSYILACHGRSNARSSLLSQHHIPEKLNTLRFREELLDTGEPEGITHTAGERIICQRWHGNELIVLTKGCAIAGTIESALCVDEIWMRSATCRIRTCRSDLSVNVHESLFHVDGMTLEGIAHTVSNRTFVITTTVAAHGVSILIPSERMTDVILLGNFTGHRCVGNSHLRCEIVGCGQNMKNVGADTNNIHRLIVTEGSATCIIGNVSSPTMVTVDHVIILTDENRSWRHLSLTHGLRHTRYLHSL